MFRFVSSKNPVITKSLLRNKRASINDMKKVILLYVMILISSIIYADEIRNVNGEARGFSNTSVIIKIKVQDNGKITAIALYDDYAILNKDKWMSIYVPMRKIEDDIANPNIPKETKNYLLKDYPKKKYYGNTKINNKPVTIIF